MERYYEFAGVRISISAAPELMFEDQGRLAPFSSDEGEHTFRFERVASLPEPCGVLVHTAPNIIVFQSDARRICYMGALSNGWQGAYLRAEHEGKEHKVQLLAERFPNRLGANKVVSAIGAEHLVVRAGGVILHASYIVHEGRAILFTAPSGTGKSTQADLWKDLRNARIINGDRAVIRIVDGQTVACGLPFAGSSVYCENVTAPLAAIVCLGQAPQTTISRITGFRAFRRVWEGCSVNTWDRTDVEMATGLLQRVLQTVPVFALDCTPDEAAVIALEEQLKAQVKP